MTHLVEVVLGRGDNVTLQRSTAAGLGNLQGIQGEDITLGILATEVLSLGTPAQLALSRQHLTGNLAVDDLVDISGVTGIGITDDGQSLRNGLEYGEQRILLQRLSLGLDIALLDILLGQFGSQVSGRSSSGSSIYGSGVSGSSQRVSNHGSLATLGSVLLVQLSQQRIDFL